MSTKHILSLYHSASKPNPSKFVVYVLLLSSTNEVDNDGMKNAFGYRYLIVDDADPILNTIETAEFWLIKN